MILRRVEVMSCGKIAGALYALLGLVFGVVFALLSLLGVGVAATLADEPGALFGALFGLGAVILIPLFYGTLGFVGGIIAAAVYNWLAGWIGGLELQLE